MENRGRASLEVVGARPVLLLARSKLNEQQRKIEAPRVPTSSSKSFMHTSYGHVAFADGGGAAFY
jgi:hypothetical protein